MSASLLSCFVGIVLCSGLSECRPGERQGRSQTAPRKFWGNENARPEPGSSSRDRSHSVAELRPCCVCSCCCSEFAASLAFNCGGACQSRGSRYARQSDTRLAHREPISADSMRACPRGRLIGRKSDRQFSDCAYSPKSGTQFAHRIGVTVFPTSELPTRVFYLPVPPFISSWRALPFNRQRGFPFSDVLVMLERIDGLLLLRPKRIHRIDPCCVPSGDKTRCD